MPPWDTLTPAQKQYKTINRPTDPDRLRAWRGLTKRQRSARSLASRLRHVRRVLGEVRARYEGLTRGDECGRVVELVDGMIGRLEGVGDEI